MGRSKDAWLADGAGDLKEADVEDVPVKGESVRVRGLPAAYSNQASSEALELKTVGRGSRLLLEDDVRRLGFLGGYLVEDAFGVARGGRS